MLMRIWMAALLGVLLAGPAAAQDRPASADRFPTKAVRIISPFAVGGASDIMARIVGQKMTEVLGQPVIVENKPGAGGNLGSDYVAKSAPDGYTLLMATASSHGANPNLYKKFPYDPVNDFTVLGVLGINPAVLGVHPSVQATDLASLIATIRANPGKFSYGSGGVGSILHLCGEQFRIRAGRLDMEHIPYRGSAPMMNDLAAGQLPLAFDVLPTILPQIQAGAVRAIANGATTRTSHLPNLPTLAEQGLPGFICYSWGILFGPARLPPQVSDTLHRALVVALTDEAVVRRLRETGMDVFQPPRTQAEATAFLKEEVAKWGAVVRETGIQLD